MALVWKQLVKHRVKFKFFSRNPLDYSIIIFNSPLGYINKSLNPQIMERESVGKSNVVSPRITRPKIYWDCTMNFSQSSASEIISHSALVLGRSACGFMPMKVGFMGVILSLRIHFFLFATKESHCFYCPSKMLRRDMRRCLLQPHGSCRLCCCN